MDISTTSRELLVNSAAARPLVLHRLRDLDLIHRIIRAEVGGLRGEMRGEIGEMRGEIASLRTDIAGVESRLTARIDTLDHEVANLAKRIWRDDD